MLDSEENSADLYEFERREEPAPSYRENNLEKRLSFKYIFNKKFSRKLTNRSGLTVDRFGYRLDSKSWKEENNRWEYWLNNRKTVFEGPNLYRAYSQMVYKFSDLILPSCLQSGKNTGYRLSLDVATKLFGV